MRKALSLVAGSLRKAPRTALQASGAAIWRLGTWTLSRMFPFRPAGSYAIGLRDKKYGDWVMGDEWNGKEKR